MRRGRRLNVIGPARYEQRQRGEPIHNLYPGLGARKTLKQFLQNEPGGENGFSAFEAADQSTRLWRRPGRAAPQDEGPHACIDKKAHFRERSRL